MLFIFGKMKIASGCFGEQLKNVDACTETDHIAANVFHLYFFERRKNVAWVAVRQA